MKNKIKEALKTKYKTLGLSESAFDGVAEMLSKTIKDETEIETSIEGVEGWLKIAQGEGDRVRNEKKPNPTPNPSPEPTPTPNPTPQGGGNNQEEMPAWVKAILDKQEALEKRLNEESIAKITTSRKSILESTLKDAPEAFRKSTLQSFEYMSFSDDDSFNSYVEQTKATANDLALASSISRPRFGGGNASKEASKEECDAIANRLIRKM